MAINRETINQVFDVKNPTQILKEKLSSLVSLPGVDDLKNTLSKELVENTIRKNLITQSQEMIDSAKNKIIDKSPEVQDAIKDIENNGTYIKNTQNFLDYCTQKSQDLQRIFNKHITGENDDYTYDKKSDENGIKTFKKSSTYCLEELDNKTSIVTSPGENVQITFSEVIDSGEATGYSTITDNDKDYKEKAEYSWGDSYHYYWYFHNPADYSYSEDSCNQDTTAENYKFNNKCLNMQTVFSIVTLKQEAESLTDSFEELYKKIIETNEEDDTKRFKELCGDLKTIRGGIIDDKSVFKSLFNKVNSISSYYKEKTTVYFGGTDNSAIPETASVTKTCPGLSYTDNSHNDDKCANMFTNFADTFPTKDEAERIIEFDFGEDKNDLTKVSIKSTSTNNKSGACGLLTTYVENFKKVFDVFKLLSIAVDECLEAEKVLDKIDDLTGMIGEVEDTYSPADGAAEPIYYETEKLKKEGENFKDDFYNYNLSLSDTFPPENADDKVEGANNEATNKDITFLVGNGFEDNNILIKEDGEKVKVLTLYSRINYLNNRENTLQDEYGKKAQEASGKSDEMIKLAQDMQAKLDSFDMSVVTKAIKDELGGIIGDLGSLLTSITTFSGQVVSLAGAIANPFSVTAAPAIILSCLMNGQEILNKIIGLLGKCDTIGLDISKIDLLKPVYLVMNIVTMIMDKIKAMMIPVEKASKTAMRLVKKVKKLV